jgi:hypothetical protein
MLDVQDRVIGRNTFNVILYASMLKVCRAYFIVANTKRIEAHDQTSCNLGGCPACVLDPSFSFVSHSLDAGPLIIVKASIGFMSDRKLILGNVNY